MSKKSIKQHEQRKNAQVNTQPTQPPKKVKKREVEAWILAFFMIAWTICSVLGTIAFFRKPEQASAEAVEYSTAFTDLQNRNANVMTVADEVSDTAIPTFLPPYTFPLPYADMIIQPDYGNAFFVTPFFFDIMPKLTLSMEAGDYKISFSYDTYYQDVVTFDLDSYDRYAELRGVPLYITSRGSVSAYVAMEYDYTFFYDLTQVYPSSYTLSRVNHRFALATPEGFTNMAVPTLRYDINFSDGTSEAVNVFTFYLSVLEFYYYGEVSPSLSWLEIYNVGLDTPLMSQSVSGVLGCVSYNDYYGALGNNDTAYNNGFKAGQSKGESIGYDRGYDRGYDVGKKIGLEDGFRNGVASANEYTFQGLIGAVFDVPVQTFQSLFNFNVLGVDLSGFLLSLLTAMIALSIIKIII